MIIYTQGNLLDAKVDALVNAVNTVGVMGKGIALQFKYTFPQNYVAYKQASDQNELAIGKVLVVPVSDLNGVKFIFNFPTKQHWRKPSKLQWIKDGLKDLREQIVKYDIRSIAVPALGCGLGGLDWTIVKPLIEQYLSDLAIDIFVYEPSAFVKQSPDTFRATE